MGTSGAAVEFTLNGHPVRAEIGSPQATLLDCLRARGLTGAKEGCAEGECGACTVVLVGTDAQQTAYQPVNSCLMFLPMAAGQEIVTVEGLAADGRLLDVQDAMAAAGGSQCGYCTPGFVMSLFAEHYRPGRTGRCDTEALSGNLCRCTGYRPIRDAADGLGPAPDDRFRARLTAPAPRLGGLALDGFTRPGSLADCVALLARDPSATVVAGGTDVAVESNLRGRRWPHLVSLDALEELRAFDEAAAHVRIGAALPLAGIGQRWVSAPAAVREWLTLFASPPIRHRATLGGNLATASPIGDAAPLLLALDASVEIAAPAGRRRVPLRDFFLDYRRTVLARGDLLTAIEVPLPLPPVLRFYKVARRRADDISSVSVAMALDRDEAGRVRTVRVALGGVAATPIRLLEAERAVAGAAWDLHAVERIQQVMERTIRPLSDHRASAAYRSQVAARLVEKCWWESR